MTAQLAGTGIGLRAAHSAELLRRRPPLAFVEVHSENYFGLGGPAFAHLMQAREHWPVSLHGIGLSLGSTDPLSREHLRRLKRLVECVAPALVSEHLAWSSVDGRHYHDLLPLPHTRAAAEHVARRIEQVQDFLGREILVENLSSYVAFAAAELSEPEFAALVAKRAGCRLLLDVNNVYVSATNHGTDPYAWIDAIPAALVGEIHLAGHQRRGGRLVDTHDAPVCEAVWALYAHALRRCGRVPTLIEWDGALPELDVLLHEAATANHMLEHRHDLAA